MRSQIRGLDRASSNAADGISLIQTAEGALNESHSILQRMRELAVQAANGTETDDDRDNLQDEIEQLQEELDRIATDTEFNTMNLLDGSLSAAATSVSTAGPKFGVYDTAIQGFLTSDVVETSVNIDNNAAIGGESAIWSADGKTLTLNLVENQTYTQAEIDDLIADAKQEDSTATGTPASISLNLYFSSITATDAVAGATPAKTEAGVRGNTAAPVQIVADNSGLYVGANKISFEALKYGADYNITIAITFDAASGKEEVETTTPAAYASTGALSAPGAYLIHLQSGHEYSEDDIESILAAAGLNLKVELSGPNPDEPNTLYITTSGTNVTAKLAGGKGLGDEDAFLGQPKYGTVSGGSGIILQVGANEGQTMSFSIGDMSANALGVNDSKVNLKTQSGASKSIKYVDEAINKVSKQRSLLGAVQNRLEHTIANLDNTAENMQSAESTIRDVDMAEEMVQYSKNNILQQAGQSMLAQANQSTQGVLSLLQG